MKKTILSALIGLTLLGSVSIAIAGETQKFDPYTQGAVSKADPYTDGAKAGKFDVYSEGLKSSQTNNSLVSKLDKFDPYTDGLKENQVSEIKQNIAWREDYTYPSDFFKLS